MGWFNRLLNGDPEYGKSENIRPINKNTEEIRRTKKVKDDAFRNIVTVLNDDNVVKVWSPDSLKNLHNVIQTELNYGDVDPQLILDMKKGLEKYKSGVKISESYESAAESERIVNQMMYEINMWLAAR